MSGETTSESGPFRAADPATTASDVARIGIEGFGVRASPFTRRSGGSLLPSPVISLVYTLAWAATLTWVIWRSISEPGERAVSVAVGVSSFFLLGGPWIVLEWERRLSQFEGEVIPGQANQTTLMTARHRISTVNRLRPGCWLIGVAVVLIAYLAGDEFFVDRVGWSGAGWAGGLILGLLVALIAGHGMWMAIVTLTLAIVLAGQRGTYTPYAGSTSPLTRSLGSFCFATALMFGAAAAVLLPGICAAAWIAEDWSQLGIVIGIVLVIGFTVALLAVPAIVLSQRDDDERTQYLDGLSGQIDALAAVVSDPSQQFDNEQYTRLRALLNMRDHVVRHMRSPSSLELVKHIPAAIVLPVASVAASWVALATG